MNVITPPHPTPPVADHERAVQRLCLQDSKKNDEVAVPHRTAPHPTPPVTDHERAVQCLCLQDSKKNDEVAVPVCAQEHERYYPTPPHPTSPHHTPPHPTGNWSWKSSAVPVSAGQQERWWGCCACAQEHERYYPTPPHPTPREHEWEMIRARKWVTVCSWVRKWVRVRKWVKFGCASKGLA